MTAGNSLAPLSKQRSTNQCRSAATLSEHGPMSRLMVITQSGKSVGSGNRAPDASTVTEETSESFGSVSVCGAPADAASWGRAAADKLVQSANVARAATA